MFIVKVMGGLGNQMFQYVFGQMLSEKYGAEVQYEISHFSSYKKTDESDVDEFDMDLMKFDLVLPIYNHEELNYASGKFHTRLLFKFRSFFSKKKTQILLREKYYFRDLKKIDNRKDIFFDGYWQNVEHWKSIEGKIPAWFKLKPEYKISNSEMLSKITSDSNAVSLHVRRGDYARLGLVTCDEEYYKSAITHIAQYIDAPHFYIFSDDIQWVKENMKFNNSVTYMDQAPAFPFEDVLLMSCCRHNIIANSTFSWWGAFLNMNSDKIVIAPKTWHPSINPLLENIVPKSWLRF